MPKKIRIHSMNPVGAQEMMKLLPNVFHSIDSWDCPMEAEGLGVRMTAMDQEKNGLPADDVGSPEALGESKVDGLSSDELRSVYRMYVKRVDQNYKLMYGDSPAP
jgi:hypothetical protein